MGVKLQKIKKKFEVILIKTVPLMFSPSGTNLRSCKILLVFENGVFRACPEVRIS
jgi:hypothetical protein